jgi:general stress protein 26
MRNGVLRDIIFNTYERSLKAKKYSTYYRVSICIDDQAPLFSFVTIHGIKKIYYHSQNDLFKWATKITVWYMKKSNTKVYDKRNSTKGAILVRIKPTKIIAEKDTAEWE